MTVKKHIPNVITLVNLLCGCLSIYCTLNSMLIYVPIWICIGLIADFADGLIARWLKVNSELGKQLDSLADMVSFGVVPSFILFQMLYEQLRSLYPQREIICLLLCIPTFLLALFAALRLAKFNIDERQTENFIGLATPASTLFVMGVLLVYLFPSWKIATYLYHPYSLYAITLSLSYLLVAEMPMFSFKIKKWTWKGNQLRFIYLLCSIILLISFKFAGISLIILLYVFFSILNNYLKK